MLAAVATIGVTTEANAQVGLSLNIGSQPAWGPSGYDMARYYYIPDIDAYYDVNRSMYVYNNGGNGWTSGRTLPSSYRFDPYTSYKVVINDPTPWRNHNRYQRQYSRYRGQRGQQIIRYSTDPRYMQNRSRSWGGYRQNNNNNWRNDRRDNDRKGWDRDNDGRRDRD